MTASVLVRQGDGYSLPLVKKERTIAGRATPAWAIWHYGASEFLTCQFISFAEARHFRLHYMETSVPHEIVEVNSARWFDLQR